MSVGYTSALPTPSSAAVTAATATTPPEAASTTSAVAWMSIPATSPTDAASAPWAARNKGTSPFDDKQAPPLVEVPTSITLTPEDRDYPRLRRTVTILASMLNAATPTSASGRLRRAGAIFSRSRNPTFLRTISARSSVHSAMADNPDRRIDFGT